jgi:hypothetical protein
MERQQAEVKRNGSVFAMQRVYDMHSVARREETSGVKRLVDVRLRVAPWLEFSSNHLEPRQSSSVSQWWW